MANKKIKINAIYPPTNKRKIGVLNKETNIVNFGIFHKSYPLHKLKGVILFNQ